MDIVVDDRVFLRISPIKGGHLFWQGLTYEETFTKMVTGRIKSYAQKDSNG